MSHEPEHPNSYQEHHITPDWLKVKQDSAERDMREGETPREKKGLHGSITASAHSVRLSPDFVSKTPGANDEKPRTGRIFHKGTEYYNKYDALKKEVEKEGWDHKKAGRIHVTVNHKGHAYIEEGNHRAAVARDHKVPHVTVGIEYKNGGEKAEGPWHPRHIAKHEVKHES